MIPQYCHRAAALAAPSWDQAPGSQKQGGNPYEMKPK